MAARSPDAGAVHRIAGVVASARESMPGLEPVGMALQAQIRVRRFEHLVVHRTVRVVARGAAFLHGVVLEDERPLLRGVALGAGLGLRVQRSAGCP